MSSNASAESLRAHLDRAVALFDSGWSCVDDERPLVRQWGHPGSEYIEIPEQVWFFLRGAIFGVGHQWTREQNSRHPGA